MSAAPAAHGTRVTAARVEWWRLWRTRRLLVLVVVFAFFGLLGPLTAAFLPDILAAAGGNDGVVIEVPDPVPADGLDQFVGNASQVGLLVVAVIAGLALAVDARPGLAVFVRTREPVVLRWLLPRWVATTLACWLAWTVGLLLAVYETVVLLGPLDAGAVVAGWVAWLGYLAFAVSVVALAAALVRTTVAVVGLALGALLGLAAVGLVPALADWVPSRLVGAPGALARGAATAGDYAGVLGLTAGLTATMLLAAGWLLGRREV
jgi:ABC-2 type transport system permease protein